MFSALDDKEKGLVIDAMMEKKHKYTFYNQKQERGLYNKIRR